MADVGGQPLLAWLLHRLRPLPVDTTVVATSTLPRDDAIEQLARVEGVECIRASESDVLSRFARVLEAYPADSVVRVTADCPLLDPTLVSAVLDLHDKCGADYTSDTLVRTFPDGLDVEVIRTAALREAETRAADHVEREHVTPFIYRRPAEFRLANLFSTELLGEERWTVDNADDLDLVRDVIAGMHSPGSSWREILTMLGRRTPIVGPARLIPEVATTVWSNPAGIGEVLDATASRVWRIDWEGAPSGSLSVSVDNGHGTLDVDIEGRSLPVDATAVVIREIQRIVAGSLQVMSLAVTDPSAPLATALELAGFESRPRSLWHWARRA